LRHISSIGWQSARLSAATARAQQLVGGSFSGSIFTAFMRLATRLPLSAAHGSPGTLSAAAWRLFARLDAGALGAKCAAKNQRCLALALAVAQLNMAKLGALASPRPAGMAHETTWRRRLLARNA
jgi:hypothetical protein